MIDRRRLFRAQFQDISVLESKFSGVYKVSGSKDSIYVVNITDPSCTCPDWEKRKPSGGCKHILRVKLENGDISPLEDVEMNQQYRENSNFDAPEDWDRLRIKTLEKDNHECQICGKDISPQSGVSAHVHHIEPRSRGGADELYNLISLCRSCHENQHGFEIKPDSDNGDRNQAKSKINKDESIKKTDPPLKGRDLTVSSKGDLENESSLETNPHRYWHFIACSRL